MQTMTVAAHDYDFSPVHAAMARYVDDGILAGVSSAVLVGRELVDVNCVGWADKERSTLLRTDHLFRIFSNTKLITSCAVLLLLEAHKLALDEPVERYIPQLGNRRVLRPGATVITDTVPAKSPITIRQLMSHTSGLSYGLLDPDTLMYAAYNERQVRNPMATLAGMMDTLAELPLSFQPGTQWEYSVATDVLARLVEVVSGVRFGDFIRSEILEPLGMVDTGFVVPPAQQHRLTTHYDGVDPDRPMLPGLTVRRNLLFPQAYLQPLPWQSGGGGLISSLPDMVALMRALLPGGATLLKPETIAQMMTNQLPDGVYVRFPDAPAIEGMGFGLAGSVTLSPAPDDPAQSTGEFQWGGIAGTHWWISPKNNLCGLLMTQRHLAFWHPYALDFKQRVYEAVLGRAVRG